MQRHNSLVSADSRILLYLLNYHGSTSQFDVSVGLTQTGIAQKTNISQCYASRPLKSLVEKGYVQECVGYTKCGKRKYKYYILTDEGKEYSRKLKKELSKLLIIMKLSDDTSKIMKLNNIIPYLAKEKICSGISEMDIYALLTKDGVLNIESLKNHRK
jgi:DNA-binding MarR family transcriptional regulator